MQKSQMQSVLALMVTAFIWGAAFVAQSTGGDMLGPFTFSCLRFSVGALALLPVIKLFDRIGITAGKPKTRQERKDLWKCGICCGFFLSMVSLSQQLGLYYGTPAGKAGFLSACYIVIVPILGLFLKRTCGWNVWAAVAITLAGLYLLCIHGDFSVQTSDLLVLCSSLMSAFQLMTVDHYAGRVDVARMPLIQFVTAACIAFFPMFFSDMSGNVSGILRCMETLAKPQALGSILYAGVLSGSVAYTLQNIGQRHVHPAVASLILSLESVFAVLAGWVVLGQSLSLRELAGCGLVFAAIILAQIPMKKKERLS
ncbi:MAG: DMT family transporter [Emergencia sp.]|jgi:drug/metabolite transporter (DMT)-like permease|uniref:DMT family transporter n=1 Tax=Emergencia sp. 1XD21-10 TaxID=2304569 RepID=UPI00137AA25A|nr:DMT family transporter [Emergencia sp. 1XD21-10]MCI9476030.1 DMT family transporter [Emergencia sp.]MCI9639058.1 DMT family transporter [Emergencia sp.]NCE99211.1 DMT family transporter [Emergencia sp. 1XD21-10]